MDEYEAGLDKILIRERRVRHMKLGKRYAFVIVFIFLCYNPCRVGLQPHLFVITKKTIKLSVENVLTINLSIRHKLVKILCIYIC